MLKDDSNFSYNGGGDAKPLKHGQNYHPYSIYKNIFCETFLYTQK